MLTTLAVLIAFGFGYVIGHLHTTRLVATGKLEVDRILTEPPDGM